MVMRIRKTQWDLERGQWKEGLVGLGRGWGETSLCQGNGCLEANQGRDWGEGGSQPHLLLLASWPRTPMEFKSYPAALWGNRR